MKVLVTGSRHWSELDVIESVLWDLSVGGTKKLFVIHGCCDGADTMAGYVAERSTGMVEVRYPANWKKYGLAAGPIRNREMFDKELPDLVIAFHDDISKSKGAKDMIKYAKSKGCTGRLYNSKGKVIDAW